MPKFKKKSKKVSRAKKISKRDEQFIMRSLKISAFLAIIFSALSLLLNGEIITYFMNRDVYWDIIDVSIKVSVIIFSFLFSVVSVGNYKELTGKPIEIKEILLFIGLSLLQTVNNLYVFIFTLIGIVLLSFYLFFIQES
jgi:hypothetical protein